MTVTISMMTWAAKNQTGLAEQERQEDTQNTGGSRAVPYQRPCVVERFFAWIQRRRRGLNGWERDADNFFRLLQGSAAV